MTLHSGPGIGEMLSGACHRCRARSGPACGLDPTLARMDCAHFNPGAAASEPVREMAAKIDAPLRETALSVGSFYRTRGGRKIGPMRYVARRYLSPQDEYGWVDAPGGDPGCWDHRGRSKRGDPADDLVAMWLDDETLTTTFAPIEDIVGTRPTKAETLDAAKAAVADRGLNYGTPEDNFARIAALWQTHLVNRYGGEHKIDPHDVAQMMVLMKVARLENDPGHLDSWTDVAGYAACGANLPVSAR